MGQMLIKPSEATDDHQVGSAIDYKAVPYVF